MNNRQPFHVINDALMAKWREDFATEPDFFDMWVEPRARGLLSLIESMLSDICVLERDFVNGKEPEFGAVWEKYYAEYRRQIDAK